jgi:hypothetical protein
VISTSSKDNTSKTFLNKTEYVLILKCVFLNDEKTYFERQMHLKAKSETPWVVKEFLSCGTPLCSLAGA